MAVPTKLIPAVRERFRTPSGVLFEPHARRFRPLWRATTSIVVYFLLSTVVPVLVSRSTGEPTTGLGELIVVVAVSLLAPVLMNRYLDQRPREAIGLLWSREVRRDVVVGLAVGTSLVLLQATVYTVATGEPVRVPDASIELLVVVSGYVIFHSIVAVVEELQDRGHLLTTVTEFAIGTGIGVRASILSSIVLGAVLFSMFHLPETSGRGFSLFCSGVLYSVAFVRTGRLGAPVGLHLANNVVTSLVSWDNYAVISVGFVDFAAVFVYGLVKLLVGVLLVTLWTRDVSLSTRWRGSERRFGEN